MLYHFRALLAEHKRTKKYGNTSTCLPSWRPSEWPFYDMENKCFHPASEIKVLSCHSSQSIQDKFSTSSWREWRTLVLGTGGSTGHDHLAVVPRSPSSRPTRGLCLQSAVVLGGWRWGWWSGGDHSRRDIRVSSLPTHPHFINEQSDSILGLENVLHLKCN